VIYFWGFASSTSVKCPLTLSDSWLIGDNYESCLLDLSSQNMKQLLVFILFHV
jgi:hypothetical protein